MTNRHTRSTRKATGGRRRPSRKVRKHEEGGDPTETTLGDPEVRAQDARGSREKQRVKRVDTVNLATGDTVEPAPIESVLENPANPDFVRRDIITKGTIVETDQGRARITSRPGQDGTVNAVLLDEE